MRGIAQRLGALLALLTLAVFVGAGCGGNDNKTTPSATETGTTTSAIQVPDAIKSKGTLVVATDASYAPMEFFAPDGKTIEGLDADFAKAIAAKLGLKADVKNVTFDAIIPGLAAHKYDVGMSSFTDTKEREQTVDFVTYFTAGTSFFTKAQGGKDITGLADLCGVKVAVQRGTTMADDGNAQSKKCKQEGKPGVDVQVYPTQDGANLAIVSGRAQIGFADSPVVAYQIQKSEGKLKATGTPYAVAPFGIAIPKDSGLAEPILEAVKATMADGDYQKILEKWGVQDSAITSPVINGAES